MTYNDPCANDPTHGAASVGVNNTTGVEGKWICIPCFEQYMDEKRDLIEKHFKLERQD